MRKRYLVAASAALALAAGGGAVAFADSNESGPSGSRQPSRAVTLPTGDAVTVSPSGNVTWHAAPGRQDKGYLLPPALDGSSDVIMIPLDRVDAIAAGKEDPRRYNVTELLRAGQHDAVKANRLSGKEYGRFVPVEPEREAADGAQKVTLSVTDREGGPGSGIVYFGNPETGEQGELELDETGKGTVELAPGRWDFHSAVDTGDEIVAGITTATVTDAPVEVTADGGKAEPLEYRTDRPAEPSSQLVLPFTVGKDGNSGIGSVFGSAVKGYVIPTGEDQTGTGLEVVPHLVGTDASDPYQYDLNFFGTDGIPADPTFTVADEDLARVERSFDGLLTSEPTTNCNNVLREGGAELALCTPLPVEWQTSRTEYLSAGPDLSWYVNTTIGDLDTQDVYTDIVSNETYDEAGEVTAVTGSAPVAFNVGGRYDDPILSRDGDDISLYLPYFDNAERNEAIEDFRAVEGTAVLKRDGEEVGKVDLATPFADFTLPTGDTGTYTLTAELDRSAEVTPLASRTEVNWQFASKPTTEATPLDISAVAFDAEGVTAGNAEAAKPQDFTLEYQAQHGATDTALTELAFEVSYDDGKTWKQVEVDRDGDSATGTLEHPEGAKLVSVRATATDDAGNEVTHATIGSYGLT